MSTLLETCPNLSETDIMLACILVVVGRRSHLVRKLQSIRE
jgi:hypothetical protein